MRFLCVLLLAGLAGLTGCSKASCEPRVPVQVPSAPPAPLDEPDSKAPIAPGLSWAGGHWHWDDHRWVWLPGHWASTPAGQRWLPPRYSESGEKHFYRAGGFSCIEADDE